MKLIGAGLPRTGTLSQKVALEMLGLAPCYHMVNVLGNLDEADHWRRALEGQAGWDRVFDGFQATVDWPGSFFWRELVESLPRRQGPVERPRRRRLGAQHARDDLRDLLRRHADA